MGFFFLAVAASIKVDEEGRKEESYVQIGKEKKKKEKDKEKRRRNKHSNNKINK